MPRLNDLQLLKFKSKLEASKARPERPRFEEEVRLGKTLLDLGKESEEDSRNSTKTMFGELSEKWKGNHGGSAGDALISGFKNGLNQGSFMDDKKRYKTLMDFTEKMKNMVSAQNVQLFKEEKLHNASQSVTPRIMAYLDGYQKMSPNDRKVYLQNVMDEYNQAAGTDYKILDATGSEPWKVIISDNGEATPIDLMDLIKTPEEKKLEYYYKSNEFRDLENKAYQEEDLNRQILENKAAYTKNKLEENSPVNIQDRKSQLIESGTIPKGSILFDEIKGPELKNRLEDLKIEREKGKASEDGIIALDEMEKIFEKHPNLSRSLAKWALSKDSTPWNNVLKAAVNQEELDALLELEKHSGTLNLGTLSQFKGQRPTDVLKKLIVSTNPGSNFTYKAFIPIKNLYKKKFEQQIERSNEAARGFDYRYFPPYLTNNLSIEKPAQESERDKIIREITEIEKELNNG